MKDIAFTNGAHVFFSRILKGFKVSDHDVHPSFPPRGLQLNLGVLSGPKNVRSPIPRMDACETRTPAASDVPPADEGDRTNRTPPERN